MSILATIDALHKRLDDTPDDHQTRGVLADALEESGDPELETLAEGYRALGAMGIRASTTVYKSKANWWLGDAGDYVLQNAQRRDYWEHKDSIIPRDWFLELDAGESVLGVWRMFKARREAEDAAALAFAKLPEARRLELLAPEPAGAV